MPDTDENSTEERNPSHGSRRARVRAPVTFGSSTVATDAAVLLARGAVVDRAGPVDHTVEAAVAAVYLVEQLRELVGVADVGPVVLRAAAGGADRVEGRSDLVRAGATASSSVRPTRTSVGR